MRDQYSIEYIFDKCFNQSCILIKFIIGYQLFNMSKDGNNSYNSTYLHHFLMGGVSSAISKTCTAPIEFIKLRLQCMDAMVKSGALTEPYTGIRNCAKRVMAEEGFRAFWKGNGTNILRYFPTQGLMFACYSMRKSNIYLDLSESTIGSMMTLLLSYSDYFIAAIIYSIDYARTRLSNDLKNIKNGREKQFNGLIDVYKKTLASDGIVGLHRGLLIGLIGMTAYRKLYFGLYDSIKPSIPYSFFASFLFG